MRSSGELSDEGWVCLARYPTRVQRGTGDGDSYPGDQAVSTSSWACTKASITSVFRHLHDILFTGQGAMSRGTEKLWDGPKSGLPPQFLLGPSEDSAKDG